MVNPCQQHFLQKSAIAMNTDLNFIQLLASLQGEIFKLLCFGWPVDQVMPEQGNVSGLKRIWKNPIKHTDTLFAVPFQSPSLCPYACWQQRGVQSWARVFAPVCVCVRMDGWSGLRQPAVVSRLGRDYFPNLLHLPQLPITSSCITMLIHWYCDFASAVNNKQTNTVHQSHEILLMRFYTDICLGEIQHEED